MMKLFFMFCLVRNVSLSNMVGEVMTECTERGQTFIILFLLTVRKQLKGIVKTFWEICFLPRKMRRLIPLSYPGVKYEARASSRLA